MPASHYGDPIRGDHHPHRLYLTPTRHVNHRPRLRLDHRLREPIAALGPYLFYAAGPRDQGVVWVDSRLDGAAAHSPACYLATGKRTAYGHAEDAVLARIRDDCLHCRRRGTVGSEEPAGRSTEPRRRRR